jgi:hypothetical protein
VNSLQGLELAEVESRQFNFGNGLFTSGSSERLAGAHTDKGSFAHAEYVQQSALGSNPMLLMVRKALCAYQLTMRVPRAVPFLIWLAVAGLCATRVNAQSPPPPSQSNPTPSPTATTIGPAPAAADQDNPDNWPEARRLAILDQVIANQKKNDEGDSVYEHIEKKEIRKSSVTAPEIKVTRNVPAGTGVDKIALGPDEKPTDINAYRAELEKLVHSLVWATEDGRAQRDAYEKQEKHRKDKGELIDATRNAFIYTFAGREPRADRMLVKFKMDPNPAYKPTSRATSIFAKVRGLAWIDEQANQLAKVEVEVTDDISIGGFLAKVYKGSHFMQERWELAPGLWLPTYSQYDFDGRRLFMNFSVHERTFYSQYKRIGPPKEAVEEIRAELSKPALTTGDR